MRPLEFCLRQCLSLSSVCPGSFWVCLNTWPPTDWNSAGLRGWLEATLASEAAQAATWRFVICYLPPFHSGTAYPRTQKMRVVADLFEAGGARRNGPPVRCNIRER
eukprot:SAG22_NODE_1967_length_3237_cov_1.563416_4_plen_106_part_00